MGTQNEWLGLGKVVDSSWGTTGVSKMYWGNTLVWEKETPTGLLPPVISLYDNSSALKIESQNDVEDQYEIYLDDTLIGTYNKFYDFESDSNGSLTKCLGRQYYTGEIVTPQTKDNVSITTLGASLFADTVASKITISEGVTTASPQLFKNTTTVNISYPSTITDLRSLNSYYSTLNIGLSGYIEYGWTNALPTMSSNGLCAASALHSNVNFYAKSTITSFGDYSLYITITAATTFNYYFDESENETITFGTNLLYVGTSKIKPTYNIYTDNASIKDEMLTYAGDNCTVNVYKRNGGSWS